MIHTERVCIVFAGGQVLVTSFPEAPAGRQPKSRDVSSAACVIYVASIMVSTVCIPAESLRIFRQLTSTAAVRSLLDGDSGPDGDSGDGDSGPHSAPASQ